MVRIDLGPGLVTHRFITLYRTPAPLQGDTIAIPITAQLPAALLGLNPEVVRIQQPEIGATLQNMLVDYEENYVAGERGDSSRRTRGDIARRAARLPPR